MQQHRIWFLGLLGLILAACVIVAGPGSSAALNDEGDALTREGKFEAALKLYDQAAAHGDLRGANNAAVIRFVTQRWNPELSREECRDVIQSARQSFADLSSQGFAPGSYNYGLLKMNSRRETAGYEYAKERFRLAIDQGDETARLPLALHLTPYFEHPDRHKRRTLLQELAQEGYALAASELANDVRGGRHPNPVAAEALYEMAAAKGEIKAQRALGMWFDRDDDIDWLIKAADQGSVVAMARLGDEYASLAKEALPCPENREAQAVGQPCKQLLLAKAMEARIKAVTTNEANIAARKSGKARHERALNSIDIRPDGLRYWDLTPAIGNNINNAENAAYDLAQTYLYGDGVPIDKMQALAWARRAGDLPKSRQLVSDLEAMLGDAEPETQKQPQ